MYNFYYYFFKIEKVAAMAKEIPKTQFKVIANSGHLPNMEYPEIFNQLILNFYAK